MFLFHNSKKKKSCLAIIMYHILKCYSYNYCKNKNLFLYTSDIQELLENGSMTTNFSSQHFYLFFCIFISFHMVLTQWFYFWTQSFMSLRMIVILSEESNWFRFTSLKMKIDEFLSIYQWISFNYVKIFLIQILGLFAILLYTFFLDEPGYVFESLDHMHKV